MIELVDKILIFLSCLILLIIDAGYGLSVVPVITALTLSALNTYFDTKAMRILSALGYTALCQFAPQFLVFLPLVCYDIFVTVEQPIALIALVPLITHFSKDSNTVFLVLAILAAFSYLLRLRTLNLKNTRLQYMLLRDTSKEKSLLLEKKNNELMEKQDYEINMATLNERNRISMEIHDNVGHLLSRCLLQLGALMTINKDLSLSENLSSIKNTLSQAMDSIRTSVHNLHDQSLDLYSSIKGLTDNFEFCRIHLDYDINGTMGKKLKYCFITIVKEALSNILRHSNATEVSVSLIEHPALYQLIVQDNGKVTGYNIENGIGLSNISERVRNFNGNMHINIENGFKIFISIPKEN
ncbi:sensor histidine kinase LiaS [Ruminiclostridium hungatei]|uniref:histidine kinase n=1 Tax=Ruminiclostridium hungatei TaxID=48256 RepID=A0A1V4SGN8_RUMHU|nr:histidine kinase [Ruminiclostridium hungatei]OPX42411.1 sensor histidine kinase LiaS [Ruminiclostridium hungatei]